MNRDEINRFIGKFADRTVAGQEVDCWVHLECPGSVHTAVGPAGFAKRFKGDIHQRTEKFKCVEQRPGKSHPSLMKSCQANLYQHANTKTFIGNRKLKRPAAPRIPTILQQLIEHGWKSQS